MNHPTLAELLQKSGSLPSIPRIVTQVLKELDSEDPNPKSIVMLVSTDPALTAKIIALSNSPLFSGGRTIHSLNDALNILGFSHVRAIVTTAALSSSFKSVPGFDLEIFWHYSLNTALVCKTLGRYFKINEGAAFTAGLVHAIGELVLNLGALESMNQIKDVPFLEYHRLHQEKALFGYHFADVSAAFAEHWGFPEAIVRALAVYALQAGVDYSRDETPDTLAAVLHLASWRARTQVLKLDTDAMRASLPIFASDALGMDFEEVLEKDPTEWTSSSQVAMFLQK